MKLSSASVLSPVTAALLFERAVEGPRLKFDYDNYHNDPKPDILLLGTYTHPTTGNQLVGGINLHYLDQTQTQKLIEVLPQLLASRTLYGRYHAGQRLLPDVFASFYRTYDRDFIHDAKRDVLYARPGLTKAAIDWISKKIGDLFRGRRQRELDRAPAYPADLDQLQQDLTQPQAAQQAVHQAAQQATEPVLEPQAAPETEPDVDTLRRAQAAYERLREPTHGPADGPPSQPETAMMAEPDPEDLQLMRAANQPHPPKPAVSTDDETDDEDEFMESLVYYAPGHGYIVE